MENKDLARYYATMEHTRRKYRHDEIPADWEVGRLSASIVNDGLNFGLSTANGAIWVERTDDKFQVCSPKKFAVSTDELAGMMGLADYFGPGCEDMVHHGYSSAVARKYCRSDNFLWVPMIDEDHDRSRPLQVYLSTAAHEAALRLISSFDPWWVTMWKTRNHLINSRSH